MCVSAQFSRHLHLDQTEGGEGQEQRDEGVDGVQQGGGGIEEEVLRLVNLEGGPTYWAPRWHRLVPGRGHRLVPGKGHRLVPGRGTDWSLAGGTDWAQNEGFQMNLNRLRRGNREICNRKPEVCLHLQKHLQIRLSFFISTL